MEFHGLFKENIFKFRKWRYNIFPFGNHPQIPIYLFSVCGGVGGGIFYVLRPLDYLTCVTSYFAFSFLLSTYV